MKNAPLRKDIFTAWTMLGATTRAAGLLEVTEFLYRKGLIEPLDDNYDHRQSVDVLLWLAERNLRTFFPEKAVETGGWLNTAISWLESDISARQERLAAAYLYKGILLRQYGSTNRSLELECYKKSLAALKKSKNEDAGNSGLHLFVTRFEAGVLPVFSRTAAKKIGILSNNIAVWQAEEGNLEEASAGLKEAEDCFASRDGRQSWALRAIRKNRRMTERLEKK